MAKFGGSFASRARSNIRQRQPSPRHTEHPGFHRPRPESLESFGAGDEAAEGSRSLGVSEGCEAGVGLEVDGWRGTDASDSVRLRALKSVCKRKVTEKGLIHHMETVRE